MPNGDDKNLFRLSAACGEYRERFGEWPSVAELNPVVLRDLADLLSPEDFAKLDGLLHFRATEGKDEPWIAVSGSHGRVVYVGGRGWELAEEARRWFGVETRPDT